MKELKFYEFDDGTVISLPNIRRVDMKKNYEEKVTGAEIYFYQGGEVSVSKQGWQRLRKYLKKYIVNKKTNI